MENDKILDALFFALADANRRRILTEISEGPKTVGALACQFDLTIGAISKKIAILEKAGLVFKRKRGRQVFCYMNFDQLHEIAKFTAMHVKFWENRLDELETYINIPNRMGDPL